MFRGSDDVAMLLLQKHSPNYLKLKPRIALFLYTPSSGSFKTLSAEEKDQEYTITYCRRA
jgi:hypothetical protein